MTRKRKKVGIVLGKIMRVTIETFNETTEKTQDNGKWKAALWPLLQVLSLVGRLAVGIF